MRSTVIAIAIDTQWQGLDGIIDTTDIDGHHIVHALAALYKRNTTSSDLREYIKGYIGVQYNAVIEKATSSGSNIYGLPWTGPPATSFSSLNQTVAMTALLSAIQLVANEPSSKSSDNPTSSRTPIVNMVKKNVTGAIIGGVVGGVAILAVIIACVLLCCRRHCKGNHAPLVVDEHSPRILTPFMATSALVEISQQHRMIQTKNARCAVEASRRQSSASPGEVDADATRMNAQIESTAPLVDATNPPNLLPTERREDSLQTNELMRLLHERLLRGRLNDQDDEMPPEYSEGGTT